MKSFYNEYEPDKAVGLLILRGLQHALYAAEDYLEDTQSTHRRPSTASQVLLAVFRDATHLHF